MIRTREGIEIAGKQVIDREGNYLGDLSVGSKIYELPKTTGYAGRSFAVCNRAGQVYTSGSNYYSALGNGSENSECRPAVPQRPILPVDKKFVQVSIGNGNALALSEDGYVYSWGRGNRGALASGGTTDRKYPEKVSGLPSAPANMVRSFYARSLETDVAVVFGDDLYVAGANTNGSHGRNNTGQKNVFYMVTSKPWGTNTIVDVVGDGRSMFVLASNGRVYGSGRNDDGVLGRGNTTDATTFAEVTKTGGTAITGVTKIALASEEGNQTLFMLSGTSLFGVGDNGGYSLGIGNTTNQTRAVNIDQSVADFAVTGGNACSVICLKTNGQVWGFGYNNSGCLGRGNSTAVQTPVALTNGGSAITNATRVLSNGPCCTRDQLFYVDEFGKLWGAGDGAYGSLGHGDGTGDKNTFTEIPSPEEIVDIVGISQVSGSNNYQTNFFMGESGRLYACGLNALEECGIGITSNTSQWVMAPFVFSQ